VKCGGMAHSARRFFELPAPLILVLSRTRCRYREGEVTLPARSRDCRLHSSVIVRSCFAVHSYTANGSVVGTIR